MGNYLGYARVSTFDQNLDLQMRALKEVGCYEIFQDIGVSGAKKKRPQLDRLLEIIRPGDTLVVWRLDRLGRSLSHLIELVNALNNKGIGFKSLTEAMDTNTPNGKLLFHLCGAMAEFERSLIQERVKAGQAAAKARGVKLGPPQKLTHEQVMKAQEYIDKGMTVTEAAKIFNVTRYTLYNHFKKLEEKN